MQMTTKDKGSGVKYGVLNVDRNQFVPKLGSGPIGIDESVFNSRDEAKAHLQEYNGESNATLVVAQVCPVDGQMVPEDVEHGEIIDLDRVGSSLTVYVRSGKDVYALEYTLTGFSEVPDYTPFC